MGAKGPATVARMPLHADHATALPKNEPTPTPLVIPKPEAKLVT